MGTLSSHIAQSSWLGPTTPCFPPHSTPSQFMALNASFAYADISWRTMRFGPARMTGLCAKHLHFSKTSFNPHTLRFYRQHETCEQLPGEGRADGISIESNTCRWSPGYPTAEGYGLLLTHHFIVNRLRARLIQGTPLAPCRSTRRFGERASYKGVKRNVYARFERFGGCSGGVTFLISGGYDFFAGL